MENKKLYKGVADSIAADIEAGRYRPADKLPAEREFVEQYGVSRPTIREAMLVLEVRGLVEPRHGSGVYVTQQPRAAAVDVEIGAIALMEARALVEAEAAALAAVQITDAEIAELEDILSAMIEENRADCLDVEKADRAFHLAIARSTHNDAMVAVVDQLWTMREQAPLCRAMLTRARQNGLKPTIADHRAILDALKARDPAAARGAMRQHLYRVIDGLLEATEMETMERTREELKLRRTLVRQRRI